MCVNASLKGKESNDRRSDVFLKYGPSRQAFSRNIGDVLASELRKCAPELGVSQALFERSGSLLSDQC